MLKKKKTVFYIFKQNAFYNKKKLLIYKIENNNICYEVITAKSVIDVKLKVSSISSISDLTFSDLICFIT